MLKDQVYTKSADGASRTRKFTVKPLSQFTPFLRWQNRSQWEQLDERIKELIASSAEGYLGFKYPLLGASDFRQYYHTGDRSGFEALYFSRRNALATLVLGECIYGDGRYMDDIINGIWCICEETSWVVPAHNFIYEQELINGERTLHDIDLPVLDIFAGETAMLLSMTLYMLQEPLDREEPLVTKRIRHELKRRIITPFLTRYDYWWMGYSERRDINNWGPWCVVNCLIATLFCEQDDALRKRAVVRSFDMLDYYMSGISEDGGCDEGATYWGRACGMLLEGLSLVHYATDGAVSDYTDQKLHNFAHYIRKLYIGKDYVVNFADGAARCNPAAEIIFTAGQQMNDRLLSDFGAYCFEWQLDRKIFPTTSLSRALASLKQSASMLSCSGKARFEQNVYLDSLQVMVARESTLPDYGWLLCAKGGSNGDSHNHNDVGSFVAYLHSTPILVDIGVEVYRREFFGADRYSIWTMQSQYHNLPTINGEMQLAGSEFAADDVYYSIDGDTAALSMDIARTYGDAAGVASYRRTVTLDMGKHSILLHDRYSLTTVDSVTLNFITPCDVEQCASGLLLDYGVGKVFMELDTTSCDITVETLRLNDQKLNASWGKLLYRVIIKQRISGTNGDIEIKLLDKGR